MSGHVRHVVLKIASRCNLNCSYCYLYNHADRSIDSHPKRIPDDVVEQRIEVGLLVQRLMAGDGVPVLYSSSDPDAVRAVQERYGRERAAEAFEQLFADVARACARKRCAARRPGP